ncbi:hypothetical protein NDU88_005032 [Pleurodeles waltl]|uniref:Uncharacterized protein n=1 Tax=Pleurodeles waltl TaxID=8319 RepID=A0AAV7UGX3_PLEWA|nr:hypothetical protein NDU88_005032 [Pleurodeles waltl]
MRARPVSGLLERARSAWAGCLAQLRMPGKRPLPPAGAGRDPRASGGLWPRGARLPGGVAWRSEACHALGVVESVAVLRRPGGSRRRPSGRRSRWSVGAPGNWLLGGPPVRQRAWPWVPRTCGLALGLLALGPCWWGPMVLIASQVGPGGAF